MNVKTGRFTFFLRSLTVMVIAVVFSVVVIQRSSSASGGKLSSRLVASMGDEALGTAAYQSTTNNLLVVRAGSGAVEIRSEDTFRQVAEIDGCGDGGILSLASARGQGSGSEAGAIAAGCRNGTLGLLPADGSAVTRLAVGRRHSDIDGAVLFDEEGSLGGGVIGVSGDGAVWQASANGKVRLIVDLKSRLKGGAVFPDDITKYGWLAGKLAVGAPDRNGIYIIDGEGQFTFFDLGIKASDIDIIPAGETYYGISHKDQRLYSIGAEQLKGYSGSLLIADSEADDVGIAGWDGNGFIAEKYQTAQRFDTGTFAPVSPDSQLDGCVASIAPTDGVFDWRYSTGTIAVNAPAGCTWTASSNSAWLTITSGLSGTGDGTVGYAVNKNLTDTLREGAVTVDSKVHTVHQSRNSRLQCKLAFTPANPTATAIGGAGTINFAGSDECAWAAVSEDPFITLDGQTFGTGGGSVSYNVATNFSGQTRQGGINFGPFTGEVRLTQAPNLAPIVNAGADQTVALPNTAQLNGTATDDGVGNALTVAWSEVSGPATVLFGSAAMRASSVIFSKDGTYVLRLTATDGYLTSSDDIQITVNPDPIPPPPDPATLAPPLDPTVATNMFGATKFLYSGANAIQTGVAADTIKAERVNVLKGRVVDKIGQPIPKVMITIADHPELGETMSRADGKFDLAVNGGGLLTVKYDKVGLMPLERQTYTPRQDFSMVPDVVMSGIDPNVTSIDLDADIPVQVAQGGLMTDSDGSRKATLLFAEGTTASMTLPDGSSQPISTLHVRATEYTVGPGGPASMPGALPPTSGYTNAIEFSADEATAIGAKQVSFSQPVIEYLDNFLAFPIGLDVPSGFYDPVSGIWVPSVNGRVVKILSITGGQADLDLDGSGNPAHDSDYDALGITTDERQQLASLYSVGIGLWRVPLSHFSGWDSNWGFGPPPDAQPPMMPPIKKKKCDCPEDQAEADDGDDQTSLDIQDQAVDQNVAAPGLDLGMKYKSDRQQGNHDDANLAIPLSGASLPASVKRIDLQINIAGRTISQSFPAVTNQAYNFAYDGMDAYGRRIQGSQFATVDIGYTYDGVYQTTSRFGYNGNGIPITGNRTRQEVTLHQVQTVVVHSFDAKGQGIGGWDFSVHNVYDPVGKTLYQGDGVTRDVSQQGVAVNTEAGQLASGFSGDGGPASQALLSQPKSLSFAPDGTLFVADQGGFRVRKIAPDGTISTIAGNGFAGETGDGGPATQAPVIAERMHVARDGTVYVGAANFFSCSRVRRIGTDGIINTFAGGGTDSTSEDIPATQASLLSPNPFPAPDGSVYIAEPYDGKVRRVGTDGLIRTVAGGGSDSQSEGIPATDAFIIVRDITVGDDGTLYIAESSGSGDRVRKVGADGRIWTVAGGGNSSLDGIPALNAKVIFDVYLAFSVGPDGTLYFAEGGPPFRIRAVTTQGIITTVAGNGTEGFSGDGGFSQAGQTALVGGIAVAGDKSISFSDTFSSQGGNYSRVRRLAPSLPGFSATDIAIPSEDGSQLFRFDGSGRHLSTFNTLTGAMLYNFSYDASGKLIQITDGDGNQTTIERNGAGDPTGVVGPYGQRNALALDANGYLSQITDPAGQSHRFAYSNSGLMISKTPPGGQTYSFTYDSVGRLLRADDPASGFNTLARSDQGLDFTIQQNTSLSRVSSYLTQNLLTEDQKLVNTDSAGLQSTFLEGQNGTNVSNTPDGMTESDSLGPDPRFSMAAPVSTGDTISSPGGVALNSTFSRSANLSDQSNPLSLVSQTETLKVNGLTYSSVFDAPTRTYTDTSPLMRNSITALDAQGRDTHSQFANLNPANYTYDSLGRLSVAAFGTGSEARTSNLTYNSNGYLSESADALGRTENYDYDMAGRVTRETLPDSSVINFAYDANGNVSSITPPGKPSHGFTYNGLNLLSTYTAPNLGGNSTTSFTYDLDRQITRITRPDALQTNYGYDSAGRLQTVTIPAGSYTFAYNPTSGNMASISAPGGIALSYAYDGSLLIGQTWAGAVTGSVTRTLDNFIRPSSQSINGANTVNFGYDNDSLLTSAGGLTLNRDPQNGLLTGSTLGNVSDTFGYNGFGEPVSYTASFNGNSLFQAQYTRDKLGRVSQNVETIGGITTTYAYDYDQAGRLAAVTLNNAAQPLVTYAYDSNSNRLSSTTGGTPTNGTYDAQDRLTQYGNTTYSYTANGEMQSKTSIGQTTQYSYDVLGNLTHVTLPNATQIDYVIDGQNRRIGKKVNGTLTQGFLYQDQLEPVAELDGNNNVVSRFVYGTRSNVPDYMIKGGVTYRIISDTIGSPRLVVDVNAGTIAQRIDYDEFGVVLNDTNPGFQPFGFGGGIYDKDVGLVRFGSRDLDSAIGRWTAKDPLLFAGGDSNLYTYVSNDPINLIDPEGSFGQAILGPQDGANMGGYSSPTDLIDKIIDKIDPGQSSKCKKRRKKHKKYKDRGYRIIGGFISGMVESSDADAMNLVNKIVKTISTPGPGRR